MSLIKCSECGKEISNQAIACPNCGHPVKPVIIEQTSKKWKEITIVAWLTVLTGFISMYYGLKNQGLDSFFFGGGLGVVVLGVVIMVYSDFGSWWNHK